jgi:hypothetical protein
MSNFSSYRHKDYSGGLNNTASRREIGRSQASVLENWDITFQGRLQSRLGLTQLGGTLSNAPKSGGFYKRANGSNYILLNEGTDVRYLNSTTWTDIGNISSAQRMSYANVLPSDRIYFSSEDNGLSFWDGGAAITAVSSVPAGNVILWYQNHLFHVNNVNVAGTKYSNRVYWSDFGAPSTYTTASSYINLPGEGRAVTMNVLGDTLVIFKDNSYMFLSGYGSSSWAISASATSIENTDSSIGCVAPRGTVRVGANELWFIDNQGNIRRLTQADYGFSSTVMSDNIKDTISGLDKGKLDLAVAWYDNDKVYFAVTKSGSSTNNLVLVYDRTAASRTNDEAWTTYTGWEVADMISYSSSFSPVLTIFNPTTKKVYTHTGTTDDGVDITCRWDGKNDDYDQPERYKKYAYGYMYSQAQSDEDVDIYAAVDGSSFAKIDTFNLSTTGDPLGPTGDAAMGPTGSFILGGEFDKEEKFYFYDGGGAITGKTVCMSIRGSFSSTIFVDTFTNHFVIRSLK